MASQAVFLSYASEDGDAARHIAEALRAAGIEVWFDESELRGGDAWDSEIRRQIRDCTLFIKGMQYWNGLTPQAQETAFEYFQLALIRQRSMSVRKRGVQFHGLEGCRLGLRCSYCGRNNSRLLAAPPHQHDGGADHRPSCASRHSSRKYPSARASVFLETTSLFRALYAVDLYWVRRYDEAITQAHQALRTAPGNPVAYTALWLAYSRKGMDKAAVDAARGSLSRYGDSKVDRALERGYEEGGYKLAMRRAADELGVHSQISYINPSDISRCYLLSGDRTSALDWLEKGYEARDPNMPYLGIPIFDSVRDDPRFRAIVRGMHLPQ